VPLPLPLVVPLSAIQLTAEDAVQAQPAPAVMATVFAAPDADTVTVVGERLIVQTVTPAWEIASACPAIVSVALRGVALVLAATV
jgi:hypothetical protein